MYQVVEFDDKKHGIVYPCTIDHDGKTTSRLYVVRHPIATEIELYKCYESGAERRMSVYLTDSALDNLIDCLVAQRDRIRANIGDE